ncbi:MAG: zinc ribbon domain-containing protein [Haloarculaceae archaeon]
MVQAGALELAVRLSVATAVVVGPTLLFLGLWRFLVWLRDDELVEALARRGVVEAPDPSPVDVLAGASGGSECGNCGTVNVRGATVCRECLSRLE